MAKAAADPPVRRVAGFLDPLLGTRMLVDRTRSNRFVPRDAQVPPDDLLLRLYLSALLHDHAVVSDRWLLDNSSLRAVLDRDAGSCGRDLVPLIASHVTVLRRDSISSLGELARLDFPDVPKPGTSGFRRRYEIASQLDDAGIQLTPLSTRSSEEAALSRLRHPAHLAWLGVPEPHIPRAVEAYERAQEDAKREVPTRTALIAASDASDSGPSARYAHLVLALSLAGVAGAAGAGLDAPGNLGTVAERLMLSEARHEPRQVVVNEVLGSDAAYSKTLGVLRAASPREMLAQRNDRSWKRVRALEAEIQQAGSSPRRVEKLNSATQAAFEHLVGQDAPTSPRVRTAQYAVGAAEVGLLLWDGVSVESPSDAAKIVVQTMLLLGPVLLLPTLTRGAQSEQRRRARMGTPGPVKRR
jgi:hypothetical protein